MSQQDPTAKGSTPEDEAPEDEAEVRRLLERAGPRPPIPAEDLEAITAAARAAWRREVARRREDPETAGAAGPEPRASTEEGRESLASFQRSVDAAADRPSEAAAPAGPAASPGRHPADVAKQLLFAAAVLLGIGLFWWLFESLTRSDQPVEVAVAESVRGTTWVGTASTGGSRPLFTGENLSAGATLATATGTGEAVAGRASLRLSDGTVVRVDAGTIVRIDSPTAVTLEDGRIYVDSGESGSGLTIRTRTGTATDVGTRFSVRMLESPVTALEVRVRDGLVAVERSGRRYEASAGEELVVGRSGDPERRSIDPWGPDWDWVLDAAAGFPIEGRTLGELLDWVTRETGWTVRWADPGLAASARRIVLRGGIGRLRPDQAPFSVLPGAGLDGELVEGEAGDELVIRPRQNS